MARMTKEEVEAKIDAALQAGKIWNTDLTEIKDALSRLVDQAKDQANNAYLAVSRTKMESGPLEDFYYAPRYPHQIPGLGKKLPKTVTPEWQPALDTYRQFLADWTPICEKFIALKKLPVEKGRKPVEVAKPQEVDQAALKREKIELQSKLYGRYTMGEKSNFRSRIREINAILKVTKEKMIGESPIFHAVKPLKDQAIEYAMKREQTRCANAYKILAKHGWVLDRFAPKPSEGDDADTVQDKNGKRSAFIKYCERDWMKTQEMGFHKDDPNAPMILKASKERENAAVKAAMDNAAQEFDSFVIKLDDKVGKHTEATISGSPWQGSYITVTMPDGSQQVWHTQQIINYSKLGNPYNQWPTRRAS